MIAEHDFLDPLSGQTVTLVMADDQESTGVRHIACEVLARVSPELDSAYCTRCSWQCRISGAWFMDLWQKAHETAEEGAARLLREEVEEHVSEIMFAGSESPDPDCLLCKHGIEMGVWEHYGVDDPFAPEDAQ